MDDELESLFRRLFGVDRIDDPRDVEPDPLQLIVQDDPETAAMDHDLEPG